MAGKAEIVISGRDDTRAAFESAKKSLGELGISASAFKSTLIGIASIGSIVAFGKSSLQEFAEAERAVNRLDAALKSTRGTVGISRDELQGLADTLSKKSLFDDEEIRAGITNLLRFRSVQGEVFKDATTAALDYAAATGKDLPESFTTLGRALSDPEKGLRALKDAGIIFGDSAKENIKNLRDLGQTAAAQRIILDELKKSIGGEAGAENTGTSGSLKTLAKNFKEFQESVGNSSAAKTGIDLISGALERLKNSIDEGKFHGLRGFLTTVTGFGVFNALSQSDIPAKNSASGKITKAVDPRIALQDQVEAFRENNPLTDYQSKQEFYNRQITQLKTFLKARLITQQEYARFEDQFIKARDAGLAKAPKDDPTKQLLDNSLKALENNVSSEKDLFDARNRFIDLYNSENLISIKDYFAAKQNIQDENLAKTLASYDEEIKALQKFQATANRKDSAEAQGKINDLVDKKAKLERGAAEASIQANIQQSKATEDYRDKIQGLNADLLELTGSLREAALIRFDLSNKDLLKRANVEQDADAQAKYNRLRELTAAQAEANDINERASLIQNALSNTEARIDISRKVGAISELQSLYRTNDARSASIEQLKQLVSEYQEVGRESGNPKLIQDADNLRLALEQLQAEGDLVAQKFDTIFKSSFADAFGDFLDRSKSASEAFHAFIDSVVQQISRIASEDLASQLFGSISGGSGGGSSIFGSFFSSLFSSGSSGSSATAFSGGITIPSFDVGTDFVPRDMLAMVHKGEQIVPAAFNKIGGQSSKSVNQSFAFNFALTGPVDKRTQQQLAAVAGNAVQVALRRNG